MFEPKEESLVLDIVRGFFDIPAEEMMKIGDLTKKLLFDPGVDSEEAAVEQIKAALKDMPKEHALIAGVFISGLLRCNLAQQIQQQCMQEMAEGGQGPD
ncbi:MAG TPA: hypothetical protein VLB04_00340 [Methanotrichaceae archaeon]|nr:hypothetical protein [Methanotrichaceae archaeon]